MIVWEDSTSIYQQTIAFIDAPLRVIDNSQEELSHRSTEVALNGQFLAQDRLLLIKTSRHVPSWETLLDDQYRAVGQALYDMQRFNEDDDWHIQPQVYVAACYVASALCRYRYTAPKVSTHSSTSVVFNWANERSENLYLTVSTDKLSVLISDPKQIKKRAVYSLRELASGHSPLAAIRAAYTESAVRFIVPIAIEQFSCSHDL